MIINLAKGKVKSTGTTVIVVQCNKKNLSADSVIKIAEKITQIYGEIPECYCEEKANIVEIPVLEDVRFKQIDSVQIEIISEWIPIVI